MTELSISRDPENRYVVIRNIESLYPILPDIRSKCVWCESLKGYVMRTKVYEKLRLCTEADDGYQSSDSNTSAVSATAASRLMALAKTPDLPVEQPPESVPDTNHVNDSSTHTHVSPPPSGETAAAAASSSKSTASATASTQLQMILSDIVTILRDMDTRSQKQSVSIAASMDSFERLLRENQLSIQQHMQLLTRATAAAAATIPQSLACVDSTDPREAQLVISAPSMKEPVHTIKKTGIVESGRDSSPTRKNVDTELIRDHVIVLPPSPQHSPLDSVPPEAENLQRNGLDQMNTTNQQQQTSPTITGNMKPVIGQMPKRKTLRKRTRRQTHRDITSSVTSIASQSEGDDQRTGGKKQPRLARSVSSAVRSSVLSSSSGSDSSSKHTWSSASQK